MNNKELESEAEKYCLIREIDTKQHIWQRPGYYETPISIFIAGATSKYVEVEKLKAQLDILNTFYYGEDLNDKDILNHYINMYNLVKSALQQKLKELENEQSND